MHKKVDIIHQAKRWANRRISIIKHNWSAGPWRPDHYFSKGKVHCSCPMCSAKTKDLGWKHSDKKKLLKELEDESID